MTGGTIHGFQGSAVCVESPGCAVTVSDTVITECGAVTFGCTENKLSSLSLSEFSIFSSRGWGLAIVASQVSIIKSIIDGCNTVGLVVSHCTTCVLDQLVVENTKGKNVPWTACAKVEHVKDLVVKDCTFENSFAFDGDMCCNFLADGIEKSKYERCIFRNVKGNNVMQCANLMHQCIDNSDNFLNGCDFSTIVCDGGASSCRIVGGKWKIENCNASDLKSCRSEEQLQRGAYLCPSVEAFRFLGSLSLFSFLRCQAQNIENTKGQAAAFCVDGQDILIHECVARSIKSHYGTGAGFFLYGKCPTVTSCDATECTGTSPESAAFVLANARAPCVQSCTASNCDKGVLVLSTTRCDHQSGTDAKLSNVNDNMVLRATVAFQNCTKGEIDWKTTNSAIDCLVDIVKNENENH